MRLTYTIVALALLLAIAADTSRATAGTVRLDGIADGDTTYTEQQSDAFFRMDLYDPPPRETQQRFHLISNPTVTIGNLAFDGFPNDEDFRLGLVTFDDSAIVGGAGIAPITALQVGVGFDPTNPSHINFGRWAPTNTTASNVQGTVTLLAGNVVSIDLTADIAVTINPIGSIVLTAPGTFSVAGNRFEGHAQVSVTGNQSNLLIWDFSGTLSTVVVPEPTGGLLALSGLAGLAVGPIRRYAARRRGQRSSATTAHG